MLHLGNDNLITLADTRLNKAVCHEVDRLGCASGEDDSSWVIGAHISSDNVSRVLVRFSGSFAKSMDTPMNVGVVLLVVAFQATDDSIGFCVVAALSR